MPRSRARATGGAYHARRALSGGPITLGPALPLAPVPIPLPFTPFSPVVPFDAVGQTLPPVTLTALPRVVNLELYRGDDFIFRLDIQTASGPFDVTGSTVRAHIRATPDDPALAGQFSQLVAGASVWLQLPAAVSQALPNAAVWDCELVLPGGTAPGAIIPGGWTVTIAAGSMSVTPDVTR